jgi:DNA-binding response OmpR family regulator
MGTELLAPVSRTTRLPLPSEVTVALVDECLGPLGDRLERLGYEVVRTPLEALPQFARVHEPDVVIVRAGPSAAAIERTRRFLNSPVLAIGATGTATERRAAIETGADE